ncbi:hypothetical protein [Acetobacterium malicum]|uniref:hypothetical protein n=1 Tax=Acetobacterium malicum TaxID=52692 RepID=UPI0035930AAD
MITILCSGSRGDFQPYIALALAWAHRSYDLGVGAKPIYRKHLTADKLVAAIQYALTDPIITNARKLAHNIGTEQGARAGAKIIADYLAR